MKTVWKDTDTTILGTSTGYLTEFHPQESKLRSFFKVSDSKVEIIEVCTDNPNLGLVGADLNRQLKLLDFRNSISSMVVATMEDIQPVCGSSKFKMGKFCRTAFSDAKWLPDGHTMASCSTRDM